MQQEAPKFGTSDNGAPIHGELGIGNIETPRNLNLSKEEMIRRVEATSDDFVISVLPKLFTMVFNGEGKQLFETTVAGVKGDKRMLIDLASFAWFTESASKQKDLPFVIFGEEAFDDKALPKNLPDDAKFVSWSVDPIENSDDYLKGIRGSGIFVVFAAFDQDGNVLDNVAIDIRNATVMRSKNGKNTITTYQMLEKPNGNPKHKQFEFKTKLNEKTNQQEIVSTTEEVFPSKLKTINDPEAIFYTFMSHKKYARSAIDNFLTKLMDKADSKTFFGLSRGGSHIYPYFLANGRAVAYAIAREPGSEVYPSQGFIEAANLTIFSVNKDGSRVSPKFNPRDQVKKNRTNPEHYKEEVFNFLVVAVTPEIAEEIDSAYQEQQVENEVRNLKLEFADAQKEAHPEEFEIFKASQQQSRDSASN